MLLWIVLEVALGLFMWSADDPIEDQTRLEPLIGAESGNDGDPHRA